MTKKLLAALLVLVAAVSACSATNVENTDKTPDEVKLFADVISSDGTASSGRFEGSIRLAGASSDDPEAPGEIALGGSYDQTVEALAMTIDLGGLSAAGSAGVLGQEIPAGFEAFFDEPLEFVTIGMEGWIRWGILSLLTGNENAWLSFEGDEIGAASARLGVGGGVVNPSRLLDSLADANAEIDNLGIETVRGVETNHLRAVIDLQALAAPLSASDRADLEEQFGDLENSAYPVDVWVGVDDGLMYRYEIEIAGEPADQSAGSPADSSTVVSFEFFDHGQPVEVVRPPADEVVDGGAIVDLLG